MAGENKPKKRANDGYGGGSPTKYRGEYCQKLIEHMGNQGLSYESFAGDVGVAVDTLYEWERRHKRFSEAKRIGLAKNLLFWEKIGNAGTVGKLPGFNPGSWAKNMANRHGWRDKIETDNKHEHSGSVNLNGAIVALIEEFEGGGGSDPEDV